MAKEIALREFTEGEIINDYTKITTLSMDGKCLYQGLTEAYKAISKGRPIELNRGLYYFPQITYASKSYMPRSREGWRGMLAIDGKEFTLYVKTSRTTWEGRLGFENDGVYCGHVQNRWLFRDEAQSDHFIKHFWRELVIVELGDFHIINFLGSIEKQ